jgi:hypothetical protein
VDADVKRITRVGSSAWMLVGLGFLMVGLLLVVLGTILPGPARESATVVGGAFALLGAILMCVRSGVILDRRQRTIATWRGLLVPLYKAERLSSESYFSQTHYVALSRELRHAGKGPDFEVFPVTLEGPGTDAIAIHEPGNHDKARRLAEELAKFLHLGMRDRTSGREVAREAAALDQSLRERLRHAGQSVPLPVQPPGARAILSYGASRSPTAIEIPSLSVGACARMFLMGMSAAGVVAMLLEIGAWYSGMRFGIAAQCVLLPALCIVPPLIIRNAILRERLAVSPNEIVVTRRDVFGTWTTRLAGTEIEEVALNQARGYARLTSRVVIRSDRRSIELVAPLSGPTEVEWLKDALVHFLTATTPK